MLQESILELNAICNYRKTLNIIRTFFTIK